jgi:hypothetical protein
VLGSRLIPLLAILALTTMGLASCGEEDEPDEDSAGAPRELTGDWTGQLTQEGLPPFAIAVRIEPHDSSSPTRVAYTGIDCGGTWRSSGTLESNPPQHLFTEEIDQGAGGNCKGSGGVKLIPRPGKNQSTRLQYEFDGGGITSRGVLSRTNEAGLRTVFEEAGVPPPE